MRLYGDGVFPHRRRPCPLRRHVTYVPCGRAARRTLSVLAQHRPAARPVARHEPNRHHRPAVRPRAPSPRSTCTAQDMARLGIAEGDLVHVTSRRGSAGAAGARERTARSRRRAFVAMHWGEEFVSGRRGSAGARMQRRERADHARPSARSSKQPELKHAAVKILKAELPWKIARAGLAAGGPCDRRARTSCLRELLERLCLRFSVVPFGRERCGVLLRAADLRAGRRGELLRADRIAARRWTGTRVPCAMPTRGAASSAARCWLAAVGADRGPARGRAAGRRHQRGSLDPPAAAGRTAPTPAPSAALLLLPGAKRAGGAPPRTRPPGLQLLRRWRGADRAGARRVAAARPTSNWRRCRPSFKLRHELRLLPALKSSASCGSDQQAA